MTIFEVVEATLKYSDVTDNNLSVIAPRQSGVTTQGIKKINRTKVQGTKYYVSVVKTDNITEKLDHNVKHISFDRLLQLINNKEIKSYDYLFLDCPFFIVPAYFEIIINSLTTLKTRFNIGQTGLPLDYNDYFVVLQRNHIRPIILRLRKAPEQFYEWASEEDVNRQYLLSIDKLFNDYRIVNLNVLTHFKNENEYVKITYDMELLHT